MQIIKGKTNIDFIGKRRIALLISSLLNLGIIVGVAIVGFNLGVDFAGGTLVEVKFKDPIDAEMVREAGKKGRLHDLTVQRIGSDTDASFLLRMGGTTQLTAEGAKAADEAVHGLGEVKFVQKPDLDNGIMNFRMAAPLQPADNEREALAKAKEAIEKSGVGVKDVVRVGEAQGGGVDYQVHFAGMELKVSGALRSQLPGKDFEVRRVDYVGPQVGKQLRNKGIMALLYAGLFILIYVAFRFEFKFGPGALVAMVHDVVMVAGYFLITRREFNLTSIAVLLTVLGYSINDTIVIYDRIREEMARYKGKPLPEIINIAVNDTLSRTILTSGVTALSLIGLLIFGVGEIFDFAAAMLVGIVVGTYSSVYIASPLTIWLDERAAHREQQGGNKLKAKTA
jgi:preprotein translocase subunit SecF